MGCQCSKVCLPALRRQPNRAVSRSNSEDFLDTRPRLFGVPLADLEKNALMTNGLPWVVCDLVDFLRIEENGPAILVKALRETFDRGEKIKLCKQVYASTAAGVLKSFIRDIPDGLITASVLSTLVQAYQVQHCGVCLQGYPWPPVLRARRGDVTDGRRGSATAAWDGGAPVGSTENEGDTRRAILKEAITSLPFAHYHLLHYIFHFLAEVAEYSSQNKMDISNVASVFGPCCFRLAPAADAVTQMTQFQLANYIMADLLRGYAEIFDCIRTNEDKVREPKQLLDKLPTSEHCEDLPESCQLVSESTASLEDDMAADTISMPFPHMEMINKENAPSGYCMQGECDGVPRVDI